MTKPEKEILTIGKLRELLEEWEADWTKTHDQYLGTFNSQPIFTDHYDSKPNTAKKYLGLGFSKAVPYWELGLCILPEEAPDE